MTRLLPTILLLALLAACARQPEPAPAEDLPAPALPGDSDRSLVTEVRDQISFWRKRTQVDPYDHIAWRNVASRNLTLARAIGGDALYAEAANSAKESLRIMPKKNPEAVACLAMARMGTHHFAEALQLLEPEIAESVDNEWLIAVRGDVWFATGEYERAAKDYRAAHKLKPGFATLTRLAAINWVLGDSAGSLALYRRAIDESEGTGLEPEAWVCFAMGLHQLKLGRTAEARTSFADSLRAAPDYYNGMDYLARTLEQDDRGSEARVYLETALKIRRDPSLMRRLAKLDDAAGDEAAATKLREAAERLEWQSICLARESADNGEVARLREVAEGLMDRGEELDVALEYAERDLKVRRDLEACRVMARALRLNGRPAEAVPYVKEMLRYRTTDRALWDEADAVYQQAGLPADWLRDTRPFA